MVDQVLLNDTLQKINASLNKRFEKDADLYISRQDEYEIKKNLCHGAYGGVVDMAKAKGIRHDIVVKVLLRSAGVMTVTNIEKFKKELYPIFQDANYRALSYMMEDVLSDSMYMQKEVRHIIFRYYMNGITSEMRLQYWTMGKFSFGSEERRILYELILSKTVHQDPSEALDFKVNFMKEAFRQYPSLMKNKNAILKLKVSLKEKEKADFFEYLCKEMQKPSIKSDAYDFILADTYASYGTQAFNDVVKQIQLDDSCRFKQCIKVINKLFWMEKDKDILVKMFDTVFKIYDSAYTKSHIKDEINKKVWKEAKKNVVLYQERKQSIDKLLSEVETTDKNKYTSYADVAADIEGGISSKSIAYFWFNMQSPALEESIESSFSRTNPYNVQRMREIYIWLFDHSIRKGGTWELNRLCERIAKSLYRFEKAGEQSQYYKAMDECWLDYVIKYKLKGKTIKEYMFAVHYNKFKEWNE